ncbi:MAG TPA: TetR/AcrR family transcriptional regulator [bacterium]|nr:TetR/AcrR family transcriptional regulator [bacterium]
MGIKERRDRERLEMRHAILDAARGIAAREGWQAVTIRRVAEKIEYTPPTIYEYFENKEALLAEVSREAFRLLLDALRRARDAHGDPDGAFRAMGDAYWEFVWKHPELYQVISGLGGVNFCEPEHQHPHAEAREVFETFRGVVAAAVPPVDGAPDDLEGKVLTLWSVFHGFIALLMAGRIPIEARDRARGLALQAAGDLLTAWRNGRA